MEKKIIKNRVLSVYSLVLLCCFVSQFYCGESPKSRSNPVDKGGNNYIETNAGNDTIVSINDSLKLYAGTIKSINGEVIYIEWNINNAGFKRVSSVDTTIIAPSIANEKYSCILKKIIDDYNYHSLDTMYVNVIIDSPTIITSTSNPVVTINDTIKLQGSATDKYGYIEKWEWKFGINDWVETSAGDTIIIAPSTMQRYVCSLRVTDDDGVRAENAVSIIVIPEQMGTVTDIDGNCYKTIKIGNQVWTLENLRTTKYNVSTNIQHVTDRNLWSADTLGAYCFYNNSTDTTEQNKYGALYNWYTANRGNLAPIGWHVPTDAEWDTLMNYLIVNGYNWDSTTTGNKIGKSMAATTDWAYTGLKGMPGNDIGLNNRSGFSALPGGYRSNEGFFKSLGNDDNWWSSTEEGASQAYYRYLYFVYEDLRRANISKKYGFSVRLIKD
jgi:uncharacterized protein (TIGR02145 family)